MLVLTDDAPRKRRRRRRSRRRKRRRRKSRRFSVGRFLVLNKAPPAKLATHHAAPGRPTALGIAAHVAIEGKALITFINI
jgi:hypothetical protein